MRILISTLMVGIMFMLLAVVFLTTVLKTCADYEAKTSQAPHKPAAHLDGGRSDASAAAEPRGNGDQAARSARPPRKVGREAGEQSDNSTASGN